MRCHYGIDLHVFIRYMICYTFVVIHIWYLSWNWRYLTENCKQR